MVPPGALGLSLKHINHTNAEPEPVPLPSKFAGKDRDLVTVSVCPVKECCWVVVGLTGEEPF